MSKQNNIPKVMVPKVNEIKAFTEPFCKQHLNDSYLDLSQKLLAALARKRPSPLIKGRSKRWAAGLVYCLGRVNFLFDKENEPYMSASELCKNIGVSQGTASDYARKIDNLLNLMPFDPEWTIAELIDENPMVWMLSVNGFTMDVRNAPHDVQDEAFSKGLIPYIPYQKELEGFFNDIETADLGITPVQITDEIIDDDIGFPEELPANISEICHDQPNTAIRILEKIVGKYNHHPRIYNYLAVAYSALGDKEKLTEISLENYRRNPDYIFAKLNLCSIYLNEDIEMVPKLLGENFDLAKLYPNRSKFHTSECLSYFSILAQYFLKTRNFGKAKTCFILMDKISPDHRSTRSVEEMIVRAYKKHRK